MKIKKVDDKPMVIHTKEKTKIHSHVPKGASIKGSNIYTVDRSPKMKGSNISGETGKTGKPGATARTMNAGKKSYRKSTIHQTEDVKKGRISKYRKHIKESNSSVKCKNTTLRNAGMVGGKTMTDQMEGGQEIQQSVGIMYEATRPVTGVASRGADLYKRQVMAAKKRKIKQVQAGKKLAKKTAKKTVKDVSKKVAKETAKETAKESAKIAAKVGTKAAATAAGTAVAPGVGTAIGYAAGVVVDAKIEHDDMVATNRSRKIKFFLDKMKAQDNQQDSFGKLVKDLVLKRASTVIKQVMAVIAPFLLILVLLIALICVPVIGVVATIYNSPFAIFLPPLEDGDTVQTVASSYVAEFNRDINTLANDHTGYDSGEIVYVDYEGTSATPSNYYDIICVYMVKHGIGDTAVIMNDTSKEWLQNVVDDMCSYTTSTRTDTVDNDDGTTSTTTVLCVNVTLKDYRDMITEYSFSAEQIELINEMMSPEYLAMLGYTGGGGGGSGNSTSSMTQEEINAILNGISDPTQKSVMSFALSKVGYPYSQDLRDSGDYFDCSSLAYYAWRAAGVDISFGGATTAAAEAQGLSEAGKTVTEAELQSGDLIFYSYTNNGRFMNISHVGIYAGNGKMVEAANEDKGVVYGDFHSGSVVMYARPNK